MSGQQGDGVAQVNACRCLGRSGPAWCKRRDIASLPVGMSFRSSPWLMMHQALSVLLLTVKGGCLSAMGEHERRATRIPPGITRRIAHQRTGNKMIGPRDPLSKMHTPLACCNLQCIIGYAKKHMPAFNRTEALRMRSQASR
jgi:hypothetical protein